MSDQRYYDSWKEDRDIILEYNQVNLEDASMVNILGLAVDNVTRDQSVVRTMKMIDEGGFHHIIFLNPYKIQKIKSDSDLNLIYSKASMYLAGGAGIAWASRIIGSPIKERIPILSYMMDMIRIAEIKEYTIFLVGGKPEIVERAYFNIRRSFPSIRIVGRHGGFFSVAREEAIIEAIKKSDPDLIFVGLGFPKEEKWINRVRNEFKNAVVVGVGGSLDVVSGEIKKAPDFIMERGLDWFYRIITRPWRIGRLILVFIFYIRVFFAWLFSKR